jgi:predicted methyltransferase
MDPIPLEDLALLEVLQRIDQSVPLQSGDTEIRQRLVDSGLVEVHEDRTSLTAAGIELTKSLQHRVAADTQAARIVAGRKGNGAAHPDLGDDGPAPAA